ncbi:hypothetical protein L1077_09160 [Pseudoalteromonas luteoviolacea]|uniref:STAS/SEC14 domain-containing protein n=1 Tax=Pseudoalteromonas luteoviolacea H33 TaxID=1365251 RepID=A0A161XZY9_9GAMM|nr:hypothetical protein [Pseudoalteromonas luteoviolacea]KZN46190.1 hypothetical protein N476_03445 [Pseudoalteromonas luteoviolacea H33]KZN75155.1 hypothetical protein N477_19950 [Pseudoalteromonas luteoviolacea H33-S]MBQ4875828.1 hypothetical protein [Pseudoalteromonas luteoviolacea]MBQ4904863.1 hypothetical protein [Pseudoalteromonas luteoviolacea]MCF6439595.1 hypothetical protein [Pseudoalteromonas luteoviolacea]
MSALSTSITFDQTTSLILMTVRGKAGAEDVVNAYKAAKVYSEQHGSKKVLVDVSELEHKFAAIDIVNVMPKVAHYLTNMQIARVVGFEGYMHDLFLQKVKRFGIHAENFECFKSAKEWLSNA